MAKPIENFTATDKAAFLDAIGASTLVDIASATVMEAIPFTGLAGSSSYAGYIAIIDGLVGTAAAKVPLGPAKDGSSVVWRYTAGTGSKSFVLSTGMHAGEVTSMLAAVRFFTWFATDSHPVARRLRSSIKVILLPCLNPSSYTTVANTATVTGRLNAPSTSGGVNLNRNFGHFHAANVVDIVPDNNKGTGPFSEVEAQYVKAILDSAADNVVGLIDCHNMADNVRPTTLTIDAPCAWFASNRTQVFTAADAWSIAYDATYSDLSAGTTGEPTLYNWAGPYLIMQGKRSAFSAIIECNSNIGGSTVTNLTAAGATYYCGMILTMIRSWVATGGRVDKPVPMALFAARNGEDVTKNLAAGGTLIDTAAPQAVQFDQGDGGAFTNGLMSGRKVVWPATGEWRIVVDGYLESGGTAQRVDLVITRDGVATSGVTSVRTDATANERTPVSFSYNFSGTPDLITVREFGVTAALVNIPVDGKPPRLKRMRVSYEFYPYDTRSPRILAR